MSDDGAKGDNTIEIKTPAGVVHCLPEEIVLKRLGVYFQRSCLLLEYEVPAHSIIAIHSVAVDLRWIGCSISPSGNDASYVAMAEKLQSLHEPWLGKVSTTQLAKLIGRLRSAVPATTPAAKLSTSPGAKPATSPGAKARSRRQRVQGLPPVARARKSSKVEEIRKIFDEINTSNQDDLSLEDLQGYLCDYLGFGQAEANGFFECHKAPNGSVPFNNFKEGYGNLNPYMIENRQKQVVIRKPGSLDKQQVNLDQLEDCEVYVCDPTAQVFVDFCKRCLILVAPCDSSIFIRDCEDCTFWCATKQFRTNKVSNCTFHLYAKTEPIIEMSNDLAFAPWSASYPKCTEQFSQAGFDQGRNLWNAVFDFSGKEGQSNWHILPLKDVVELTLDLDEPPTAASPPDNPCNPITHETLCAQPLTTGESCGEGVCKIPQTRPALPPTPKTPSKSPCMCSVHDEDPTWQVGAQHLKERLL